MPGDTGPSLPGTATGREPAGPCRGAAPAPLLQVGRNCQALVHCERFALLVDAAAYYRRLYQALLDARSDVSLVGWDVDGRVPLLPPGEAAEAPVRLAELLTHVALRRPVEVRVLAWDFSALFARERDLLAPLRFGLGTHPRMRFLYDGNHPLGASHHVKLAVIDDALAFAGGLDVAACRWDTREHRPRDGRRRGLDGKPYPPFHDAQVLVDGAAAAHLGRLARARWQRAGGELGEHPPNGTARACWPAGLPATARDARIGCARTEPAAPGEAPVREVEQLYLDAIAAARRWVYAETQYLTSATVVHALAERLAEPDGPEVVLVLPRTCPGWLERTTMVTARELALAVLRRADRRGRLRAVAPFVGDADVYVHAKLMVVDDRLLRVGSSNLTNRSMGLDSELDLALEADPGRPDLRAAVLASLDGLLAEHTDRDAAEVAGWREREGSLLPLVDGSATGGRGLARLPDGGRPGFAAEASLLADPERPPEVLRALDLARAEVPEQDGDRSTAPLALLLAGVAALALLWWWTPLRDLLHPEQLVQVGETLQRAPLAPLVLVASFAAASLLLVPLNVMVMALVMLLGGWSGGLHAMAGALLAAVAAFAAGRGAGLGSLQAVFGARVQRLSRRLRAGGVGGFAAVLAVRLVPVAPATLVSLACGAAGVRWRDYVLGTLLGFAPGMLAFSVLGVQLLDLLREPGWQTVASFVLAAALLLVLVTWLRRRLLRTAR